MRRLARQVGALIREAFAAAWSQPVHSAVTLITVAGMCVATLLTSGQGAAAEAAALAQIDAVGTRTIAIRAPEEVGIDASVVDRLQRFDSAATVTAFGPTTDVRNALFASGPTAAARAAYGDFPASTPDRASATPSAAQALGLANGTGLVESADGRQFTVTGTAALPAELAFLDPIVVLPTGADAASPVTLIVIVARHPQDVKALSAAAIGVLGVDDTGKLTVETSAELAALRAAISGELGSFAKTSVLTILGAAALLVTVNLLGLVQQRRRDFGRRRALGASRAMILALLLTQVGLLATLGASLGTVGTTLALIYQGAPVPGLAFTIALAVAAVLTSLAAALTPAIVASRRAPLDELRIP